MAPFRLGITGFGRLAREYYCPALRGSCRHPGTRGRSPRGSRHAARRAFPGAKVFADPAEVLAQRPDGVIIATPPSSHLTLWRAAMRAGIPALMEKPFVLGGELAEATGTPREQRLLMMDFNRRFWRSVSEDRRPGPGRRRGDRDGRRSSRWRWTSGPGARSPAIDSIRRKAVRCIDLGSQAVDLACLAAGRRAGRGAGRGGRATVAGRPRADRAGLSGAGGGALPRRLRESARGSGSASTGRAAASGWPIPTWACTLSGARGVVARAAFSDLALLGWRGVVPVPVDVSPERRLAHPAFVEECRRRTVLAGFAEAARSARLLEAAVRSIDAGPGRRARARAGDRLPMAERPRLGSQ